MTVPRFRHALWLSKHNYLTRLLLSNLNHKLIVRSYSLQEKSERIVKKKDVSSSKLQKGYDPEIVEAEWYDWWESQGYFKPKNSGKTFTMLLPPPNVTGILHLGHALTITIQDVIIRWKRMKGESVLWIPGTDHAGIATQANVEKYLRNSLNLSKHDLGRNEFIKKTWDWKAEKENKIIQQLRNLGASLDWMRSSFTLDANHSKVVTAAFIKLYEDGFIYRANSLINWSCALQSAISDIEVDWIEVNEPSTISVPGYSKPVQFGILTEFAYKICDEDEEIIVATTRPETMLGDTAIAVHPSDDRYQHLRNKFAWHPFRKCKIPIIFDEFVDPKFGTGAVKITPSHSLIDFEVGKKHNLEILDVINESGRINQIGDNETFHGLKRFDARDSILNALNSLNLYRGHKNHSTKIPTCSRSGDVIEMLPKKQWFLKCSEWAKKLTEIVQNKDLKFEPDNYALVWYEWMKNLQDWNISRQLWWGHQIPMYDCTVEDKQIWIPAFSIEEAKKLAADKLKTSVESVMVVRDEDVLDTWFSSALLPLSTSGWPESTDFKKFYPFNLMETGCDILFFWVARMVMLGTQLTGKLPFNEVLLHGMIRDSHGRKMSKSLGNVILPEHIINGITLKEMKLQSEESYQQGLLTKNELELNIEGQKKMFPNGIPRCGTDALRFTLCTYDVKSLDINFDVNLCQSNRFFANKIWQALKFMLQQIEERTDKLSCKLIDENMNLFDKWILSRLAYEVETVESSLENYDFTIATQAIRSFMYHEFCDVYLETTKPVFRNNNNLRSKSAISVLFNCLETSFRLLSPFMPYLTEHLYHSLPLLDDFNPSESIMISNFPTPQDWNRYRNVEIERRAEEVLKIASDVRKVKALYSQNVKPKAFISCGDELARHLFDVDDEAIICRLAGITQLERSKGEPKEVNVVKHTISENCDAYLMFNFDKNTILDKLEELTQRERKLNAKIEKLKGKMTSQRKSKEISNKLEGLGLELKKVEEMKTAISKFRCNE